MRNFISATILFSVLCSATAVSACSDIFSAGSFFGEASSKWALSGRTLDCDQELSPALLEYPANTNWTSTDSNGTVIQLGKTKYNFIGVGVLGKDGKLVDGLNSEGMSASLLWMEDASFQASVTGEKAIALSDLAGWLLGNFPNVKEARKALAGKTVWFDSTVLPYPAHLVLHDTGRFDSLVVEWVKDSSGRNVVKYIDSSNGYNNILANGPEYKQQLANLTNFGKITNIYNLTDGLPGDLTSMSRFARLSVLEKYTARFITAPDTFICFQELSVYIAGTNFMLQQILQMLGRVAIIHGEAEHDSIQGKRYQRTQMTLVRDHLNKKIYYRFGTELYLKMALVSKSSSVTTPSVMDSAANPKTMPFNDIARTIAFALPSSSSETDDLSIDVHFTTTPSTLSANRYLFAKTADGKILQWSTTAGWTASRKGRIKPLAGTNGSEPLHLTLTEKFLASYPEARIFAGSGVSDIDMLADGSFSEILVLPSTAHLNEVRQLMRASQRPQDEDVQRFPGNSK